MKQAIATDYLPSVEKLTSPLSGDCGDRLIIQKSLKHANIRKNYSRSLLQ